LGQFVAAACGKFGCQFLGHEDWHDRLYLRKERNGYLHLLAVQSGRNRDSDTVVVIVGGFATKLFN
jgi:hypothetical protein